MKKTTLISICMVIIVLFAANLMAQTADLGKKLFDAGKFPQRVGNTDKISFLHFHKDADGKTAQDLVVGNIKTGEFEYFSLDLPEEPRMGTIAWKKDGSGLAVARKDLSLCDIYEYSAEKPFKITKLTDLVPFVTDYDSAFKAQLHVEDYMLLSVTYLDWSPDGKQLAFNLVKVTKGAVWVLDTESGRMRQVTKDNFGGSPVWANDNKTLYIAAGGNSSGVESQDIFSVNTEDLTVTPVIATPAMELYPHVSPDGNFIAYTYRERNKQQTIYVYDIKNKKSAQLVTLGAAGSCVYPTWAGDGKSVIYQYVGPESIFPAIYQKDFSPDIFKK